MEVLLSYIAGQLVESIFLAVQVPHHKIANI